MQMQLHFPPLLFTYKVSVSCWELGTWANNSISISEMTHVWPKENLSLFELLSAWPGTNKHNGQTTLWSLKNKTKKQLLIECSSLRSTFPQLSFCDCWLHSALLVGTWYGSFNTNYWKKKKEREKPLSLNSKHLHRHRESAQYCPEGGIKWQNQSQFAKFALWFKLFT